MHTCLLVGVMAVNGRRLAATTVRLSGLGSLHRVAITAAVHVDCQLHRLEDAIGQALCSIDVHSLVRLGNVEPILLAEPLLPHTTFLLIRKVRCHH